MSLPVWDTSSLFIILFIEKTPGNTDVTSWSSVVYFATQLVTLYPHPVGFTAVIVG